MSDSVESPPPATVSENQKNAEDGAPVENPSPEEATPEPEAKPESDPQPGSQPESSPQQKIEDSAPPQSEQINEEPTAPEPPAPPPSTPAADKSTEDPEVTTVLVTTEDGKPIEAIVEKPNDDAIATVRRVSEVPAADETTKEPSLLEPEKPESSTTSGSSTPTQTPEPTATEKPADETLGPVLKEVEAEPANTEPPSEGAPKAPQAETETDPASVEVPAEEAPEPIQTGAEAVPADVEAPAEVVPQPVQEDVPAEPPEVPGPEADSTPEAEPSPVDNVPTPVQRDVEPDTMSEHTLTVVEEVPEVEETLPPVVSNPATGLDPVKEVLKSKPAIGKISKRTKLRAKAAKTPLAVLAGKDVADVAVILLQQKAKGVDIKPVVDVLKGAL